MTWSVDRVEPSDGAWASLLDQHDHLIFQQPGWSRVLAAGISSRVVCAIFADSGKPTCGLMGVVVGGLGLRIGYFSWPYGGMVGSPPPGAEFRELLSHLGRSLGVCQLQLIGAPLLAQAPIPGASVQADETNLLPLAGLTPESLLAGYERRRRQDIRRAISRGVVVEISNDEASVDLLHRAYLDTMRRTGGIARYKRSLIDAIVSEFAETGIARLSVARLDGSALGAMLVVDSSKASHGLMLVCTDEARRFEPNKLLLHTAVEDAVRRGKESFDFMPSGQSSQGVGHFKRIWKTDPVPLAHQTLVIDPLRARAWRAAYGLAGRAPFRQAIDMARRAGGPS